MNLPVEQQRVEAVIVEVAGARPGKRIGLCGPARREKSDRVYFEAVVMLQVEPAGDIVRDSVVVDEHHTGAHRDVISFGLTPSAVIVMVGGPGAACGVGVVGVAGGSDVEPHAMAKDATTLATMRSHTLLPCPTEQESEQQAP